MAGPIPYPDEKSSSPLRKRNAVYDAYMKSGGLGIGSIFDEEGSSASGFLRTINDGGLGGVSSDASDFLDDGVHPLQLQKMIDGGTGVVPIPKMEGLEKALAYIKKNAGVSETPLGNLARKQEMTDLMESGSEAFAESPLDVIAAQIKSATKAREPDLALTTANDALVDRKKIAVKKDNEAKTKAFRDEEAKLFDDQSMSIADSQKATEDTFKGAMDEFLGLARGASPDKRERTLEEYKKEFAAATGVDVSGKVDKSQALMALGLGLMQNRAGKGFDVGKILNAVGQAGEKALPALEKAKAEAKKAGLAAGQYALQSRNSDQAKDETDVEKGRQRSGFYIVPKSKGVSGFLANIDQGQLERLNPFELDALMSNKSFQEKFDVLPERTFSSVVAEAIKTPEAEALYLTKNPNTISLIPGVESDLFTIKTFDADPNVAGSEGRSARLSGDGQEQYRALAAAAQDLERSKVKFMEGFGLAEGTSAFRFTLDKVDSLAGAFGINVDGVANNTEKLKLFLNKLKAQNAKEILGEAGKTISDADRALVESIVGNVSVLESPDLLAEKMSQLYNEIIVKKERQIFAALETLDRYSGRKIASRLGGSGKLNAEEQAELDAAITAIGEQNG